MSIFILKKRCMQHRNKIHFCYLKQTVSWAAWIWLWDPQCEMHNIHKIQWKYGSNCPTLFFCQSAGEVKLVPGLKQQRRVDVDV